MKRFSWLALSVSALCVPNAFAISTILNYQGTLQDAGGPANGVYDFQFQLTDTNDVAIVSPIQVDDLNVAHGVLTTRLDFADNFSGADSRLKISVRPGNSVGAFTTLVPSTPIDPTPYAQVAAFSQFAATAQTVSNNGITEPMIVTGAISGRTIAAAAIVPAKIAAAAVTNAALADSSVDSAKIANLSITAADISSGSIGNAQLAVNAVQSAEILDHSVKVVDFAGVEGVGSVSATLNGDTCVDQTVNVPGALVGDYAVLVPGPSSLLPFKMTVTALNVAAANSLTVRVCNFGTSTLTVTTMPIKILLLR
jgi:hypothetical protein